MDNITILPNATQYVIYHGDMNQPIASATVVEQGNCTEIKAIWVEPEFRNKGLASQIVKRIVADWQGAKELIIHTSPDNDAMNHIAKTSGFSLWHRWYRR